MAADGPVLQVDGLVVRYAVGIASLFRGRASDQIRAVDGVSLTVGAGELVALVGESGSGKSSTALAAIGLVPHASGSVCANGVELAGVRGRRLRALRRGIQLICQDPYESLDPRFTVGALVEEPLLVHRVAHGRAARRALVLDALGRAGLGGAEQLIDRFPHELSGGQRQRVAGAAAIVLGPNVLVADEPVSMLDVSVRAGILQLLSELRSEGLGILLITHDLVTAAQYADRLLVMYLGRIVEEGPAQDVVTAPSHPYTRALLAAVPDPDPEHERLAQRAAIINEPPGSERASSGCRFRARCPLAYEACELKEPELQHVASGAGEGSHRAACLRIAEAHRGSAHADDTADTHDVKSSR